MASPQHDPVDPWVYSTAIAAYGAGT